MSDAAGFRPEDRVWPRGVLAGSLAVGCGALVGSAALVASAYSLGRGLELTFVFFVTAVLAGLSYVDAVRPWLRGAPVPRRARVVQPALLLLIGAAFLAAPTTGAAALCGYLAGILLPVASTVRAARLDRALDETARDWLAAHGPTDATTDRPSEDLPADSDGLGGSGLWRPARRVPKVGPALRETVAGERVRWLAWAGATVLVATGCAALGATPDLVVVLSLPGLAALGWVGWRSLRWRWALRDFERAATEPRRAYVALVTDPNPRRRHPVLGVWTREPVPAEDRLPRADAVFWCDTAREALVSRPGAVVVHEAWLDTGARTRPRWVAADAGIALVHRRVLRGPSHLAALTGAERPPRTRPLGMRAPDPTTENATGTGGNVIHEEMRGPEPWLRLLGWRVAALAVAASLLAWAARLG